MALQSSSPFGSSTKAHSLFPDSTEVDGFSYPYSTSGSLSSVYETAPVTNSVLNVNHSMRKDVSTLEQITSAEDMKVGLSKDSITTDIDRKVNTQSDETDKLLKCNSSELTGKLESRPPINNSAGKFEKEVAGDSSSKLPSYSLGEEKVIDGEMEVSDNEDIVECANCDNEYPTLQEYMDHTCAGNNKSVDTEKLSHSEDMATETRALSDVESFDGKIVYNPDGSAYIIEGDSDSEIESMIDLPQKEGVIIDKKGMENSEPTRKEIPQIDNAFFVPRNPNSVLNNPYMIPHKSHSTPIMHSYRVYDLRSRKQEKSQNSGDNADESGNSKSLSLNPDTSTSKVCPNSSSKSESSALNFSPPRVMSVPTKPILMCFICKLSFGYAKSFTSHAISEHSMDLTEAEREIMSRKNSSAIIQGIGKDKEPLMSFLEPIKSNTMETGSKSSSGESNNAVNVSDKSGAVAKETTSVSYVYTKPKLSESCNDTRVQINQKQGKDLSIRDIRSQLDADSHGASLPNSLLNNLDKSDRHDPPENKKLKLETSDDSNSQSSFPMTPMQRFLQDQDYSSQSPKSFLPPFTSSQRSGPFYGACEEHPNGRAAGVECPSCDMVLSSSQSLGGHMTMMHSRNSCKTLKCPKCNWHYKYQETLEIHMKEKHPEGDQKCMYCLTNQTHPRLARGESYSCGYKPYRCDVCNYSTTTKGNLSIHMQSDKHLNNVQDLANSGGDLQQFNKHQQHMGSGQQHQHPHQQPPPQLQQPHTPSVPSPSANIKTPPHQQLLQQQQQQHHGHHQQTQLRQDDSVKKASKPKPTWRCDVCNYETNVARNLRIHMTSEKHTHNMMVLQQNMKHMQRDMQIHQMNQLVMLQQDPSFLGLTGPIPGGITFPYDGSLMMGGLPAGFGDSPVDLSKENGLGTNGMADMQDVSRLFQCCVCNVFGTDSLESLHQHLQMDRTKVHENENISVSSGTYMCNLCQYKTTLKANFQLHCKTDKHIQRLQLVNHIKEGGANNEWRLKYLNVSNPVQVRCNCCDYYTNSIHKLQIHTGNPRHEASAQLFCHLQHQESKLQKKDRSYYCSLCKFNARTKLGLMQHVHSVTHLHSEGLKQLEMKEKGQLEVDIGDIFMVKEVQDLEKVSFDDESAPAPVANGLADEENNFAESENTTETKGGVNTALSPSQKIHNNNNTIKQNLDDIPRKGDVQELGEKQTHECPYCPYSTVNEMHIKSHLATQHTNHAPVPPTTLVQQDSGNTSTVVFACPLCAEPFTEKSRIQKHLTSVHNVNADGLQKLLALVEDPKVKMPPTTAEVQMPRSLKHAQNVEIDLEALELESAHLAAEDGIDTAEQTDKDGEEQFRCQTCSKTFANIDQLYSHQNELGHLELKQTPRGPGYLCWKKGCNQYFKTAQALQMHFREIHAKTIGLSSLDKSEYKHQCQICSLAFKSQQKLHFHAQMHIIKSAVTCNLCSKTFQSISLLRKHVESAHDLGDSELEQYKAEMYANSLAFSTFMTDPRMKKVFRMSDSQKENINSEDIAMSENGIVDSEVSSKEVSPATTPASVENGVEKGSNSDNLELVEGDLSSKEQQYFEDYINSQPFSEQSYEDPNRKFKCHRCRVAYTKQHYLTAHNKTNMHKKGDKVNYPMEKFLDPNRPYKCDICKESFTQKNILLVHYNSVSHLHKVKQHYSQPDGSLSPVPSMMSSAVSMSHSIPESIQSSSELHSSTTTTTTASSSGLPSAKKSREPSPEDDSVKPYKCNICKVSYSQGSTLDIHIRSVAHQTKASKLHELAMSGEVDLSRPLIEEPVDKALQAQQQKLLNEFLTKQTSLSQQSLLFQGLPGLTSFPGFPGLPSMPGLPLLAGLPPMLPMSLHNHMFPSSGINSVSSQSQSSSSKSKTSASTESTASASKSLEKISQLSQLPQSKDTLKSTDAHVSVSPTAISQTSGSIQICQRCSAMFASPEAFAQHQIMCAGSSSSPGPSPGSAGKSRFVGRVKTAVQRNLLENFGFECVMQFNEFNQRGLKREEEVKEKETIAEANPGNKDKEDGGSEKNENKEENIGKENGKDGKEQESEVDLPEMNKSKCSHCKKQFSSVWVLKAHEEEVHKEFVPLEIVEEVGDKFKSDFEKKLPKELPVVEHPVTPAPVAPVNEEKAVKQEMPPPPPPPPAQMQMDMLQMMNMFGMGMPLLSMPMMMNAQPGLMPMMMPPPGLDMPNLNLEPTTQRRQLEQASSASNQKRARTRINDEQLKVLRGYFDINNSPSEEQIQAMSEQTGLPMKVIKHWFRNTLFKERQRNKDSPYNFSNPPSTTLDLEEYEKTGKLTIIEESPPMSKSPSPASMKSESDIKKEAPERIEETHHTHISEVNSGIHKDHKPESTAPKALSQETASSKGCHEELMKESKYTSQPPLLSSPAQNDSRSTGHSIPRSVSPLLHSPAAGNGSLLQSFTGGFPGMSTPNAPSYPPSSSTPTSMYYDSHNYSPPGSGSTGRRANRTRFTDYQIKCLQEYFEQNAYPKDDELEHLSKMLGLSPRVIVVWFQNARQKARKIYENQPADNVKEGSGNSPYTRTTGLNYQCKKCQAVFQRYYDLIRHQKRSCFTDGEQKESNMLSDDSDSMSNVTSLDNTGFSDSESENSNAGRKDVVNSSSSGDNKKFQCDRCDSSFNQYETFKEHQNFHNMYNVMNMPGSSAFGMLQSMAASSAQQQSFEDRSAGKRKYDEEEDDHDQPKDKRLRTTILPEQLDYLYQKYQIDCNPSRKQLEAISKDVGLKKRVVQVWFQNTRARERKGQYRAHQQLIHKRCPICRALFRAKSALESHLATKHPDEMAKGEINIDAIPDAAVESPGPSSSSLVPPSPDYNKLLAPPTMQGLLPYMPPASLGGLSLPPMADPIQLSMKQYYEDSYKKYINELSATSHGSQKANLLLPEFTSTPIKADRHVPPSADDDAPLDLSKPLKVSTQSDTDKHKEGPMSQSSFSSGEISSGGGHGNSDRKRQNSGRSSVHSILGSAVDQTYMMNRFNHDNAIHHGGDHDENLSNSPASPAHSHTHSGPGSTGGNKRYRTQMTTLQVRIMKQIFQDYKTPTMAECEMLGRVIGLQKRVVQVWFQNARAKEKKAKLNMKSYGTSEMDFPKPPEECNLCNFKYSHKYTIQDHIFTKKHIDKVKEYIQSQTDAEREMSTSAASMANVGGLMHSKQSSELDQMRKMMMEEASAQNQMAQLQSMGLGPLGLPPSAMSGMGLLPPDLLEPVKKDSTAAKTSADKPSGKSEGSSRKEGKGGDSSLLSGSFGGLLPGMDPGMLPLMYPGFPGLLSGMPAVPPGMMPGAEHLLGYDPMTYGTPLQLLQIPQQAIKDVSSKLMEPRATIGQYTQDCKSISSLRSMVSSTDYSCVQEATVDVGYICKKCQMVYPAKEACVAHQRMMCFPGGKTEGLNVMLKLEQIQYECKVCGDKVSTVQEFKGHCDSESHRTKLAVYQQQRHTSGSTTPKPSAVSPRQADNNNEYERASPDEKQQQS